VRLEECKKCGHHYGSKLDDVICTHSGAFDVRIIAHDKKGVPTVIACPLELAHRKRESRLNGLAARVS